MKLYFSSKAIQTIATGAATALFMFGLSTSSAFADSKNTLKDASTKEDKIREMKVAEAKAPADADFKKLDSNGDEKISLKESVKDKALATLFDTVDADHDGVLSTEEYASYKAASNATTKGAEAAPVGY